MKIVIIGAGAMGCRFGLALKSAGADVILFDVWQEHVDAINKGLKVIRNGKEELVNIPATSDIKSVGAVDLVMIFTKAMHTESALKTSLEIMGADTPVVTLQNGLGSLSIIERYVGKERTIAGITNYQSDLVGPGIISFGEDRPVFYAKLKALDVKSASAASELCELLRSAGMNCEISDDILKQIWEKLAFNNAMNMITALIKQRDGVVCKSQFGFELSAQIAREVTAVGVAEGVNIDYDSVVATFGNIKESTHIPSMLQDVVLQRPTEVDAICGAVIEKAGTYGIETPTLKAMYSLIKMLEDNYETQVTQLN